jgi:hypothetical protein
LVELPSFSGWMSKQSLYNQITFTALLKVSPFFVFMFGQILLKGMGYPQEQSLVIPAMVAMISFVLILYWDYGNRNASTAFLPINMTLQWDNSNIEEVTTTITKLVPLRHNKAPFIYAAKFNIPLQDDKGDSFEYAIFIMDHLIDRAFRRIPRQFIAYGGSVFEGMAARFVATYANEYEDIIGFANDEQKMGHFKVFHVKWCSEDSTRDQKTLGLIKDPLTMEIVKDAIQLEIDRKSTRLAASLREAKGELSVFSEAYKDTRTKSYQSVNRLIDDVDRIKQERQGTVTRMLRDPKVRIILAIIAAAVVLYVLRYYKVI